MPLSGIYALLQTPGNAANRYCIFRTFLIEAAENLLTVFP